MENKKRNPRPHPSLKEYLNRLAAATAVLMAFAASFVMIVAEPSLTAYAHTAEGVSYQNVSGTPIMYTSGVTQSQINTAVSEYWMLPDVVRNKMDRYQVRIYMYPSGMETDDVDGSFIAVTHSGYWVQQGSDNPAVALDPPWIDIHANRMTSGTVIHEAGHVMDHLYEPGVTAWASRCEEFQQYYSKYRSAIAAVDHSAAQNSYIPQEAFAECFRFRVTKPSALMAISPDLYAYVSRCCDLDGSSLSTDGTGIGSGSGSGSSGSSGSDASPAALRPGWQRDSTGWWYLHSDGHWPASEWLFWKDNWYYFDSDGYMATGWRLWDGKHYYLDDTNGAMLHDTVTPDGYYVGSDGALITWFFPQLW